MNVRHRLGVLIGAAALFVSAIGSGQAATTDNAVVNITTAPGAALTASITGTNFGAIAYSFADSAPLSGALTLTAIDTRGTAAGWNIVLSATDFDGAATTDFIPVGQLALTPGVITTIAGPSTGQSTFPLNPVSTSAVKIWNAAVGSGDGSYSLNVPASLVVPGGTLVDTYTSVVTVAITSAP